MRDEIEPTTGEIYEPLSNSSLLDICFVLNEISFNRIYLPAEMR